MFCNVVALACSHTNRLECVSYYRRPRRRLVQAFSHPSYTRPQMSLCICMEQTCGGGEGTAQTPWNCKQSS
ncbi:hypothetical protein PISMIDRAFT_531153 [Pisolithus microcarpus 441]|uniref:Uncharacterized protein n=1 Tax=Pisolithus microcarpus 441 TaxID=765257 RepID=A0A0C9YTC1_9AGAM|nr:hypothetical protein PISMIDRAFT_531153 [Pisolithus microcarpus 441]